MSPLKADDDRTAERLRAMTAHVDQCLKNAGELRKRLLKARETVYSWPVPHWKCLRSRDRFKAS